MKKIGILGASGTVGFLVCERLQNRYEVIGGCRKNNEKFKSLKNFSWQEVDIYNKESLIKFCNRSEIIVNCAGPAGKIKDRVALLAQNLGKIYIDASDFIIVEEECINNISNKSLCIAGAGYVPGLGGILLKWVSSTLFDSLDKVVCYQGGKQHFSPIAFTDIILGAVSGVGYRDSYYRNGRILKEKNIGGTKTIFPEIDKPVYVKSYLSKEMVEVAQLYGIKELHWMNSVFDEKMVDMIMDAYQLIMTQEKNVAIKKINEMAEKYIDTEESREDEWSFIVMECRGKKEGERKEYKITFKVDQEEEASSFIIEYIIDSAIKNSEKKGLFWAFEIMDIEDISNMIYKVYPDRFNIIEKFRN